MLLKYLSRVSVLTILAVGVVACSSSGNNFSNPSTSLPPSTEQTEAEKAEAERLQNIETNRVALLAKAKTAGKKCSYNGRGRYISRRTVRIAYNRT